MESERKLIQFFFMTNAEITTHYHQNPELFYILAGELDVKIDDQKFCLKKGDIILINANKRHLVAGNDELLGARFEIDYHLLSEYMGSMQLLFWCNTVADKNAAYDQLRSLLDRILDRYFEKDDRGALYLNALYFETAYVLTSNFLIRSDDTRLNLEGNQDRVRIMQIQSYIQANYQSQISLNDLAGRLYLSTAYLSKYVKKHLGLTFMEYLNNVRLFHAVDELMYSKKNVTRIALDNGFPTSSAFTKAFKESYGESPSEYRKQQDTKAVEEETAKLSEEESRLIKEYLKYRDRPYQPEAEGQVVCYVDTSQPDSYTNPGIRGICAGKAYTGLHSDVQRQLIDIQRETGIEYVRIWDIFSKEHCYSEGICNFHKLDQVIDFLLEYHMRPYFELGYKQTIFMYTPERYLKESTSEDDFSNEEFEEIIKAFAIHLVNRYGVDEMEKWYFEYRNSIFSKNEHEGETRRNFESYYGRFRAVYLTMKEISPKIRVGGAGYVLGYEKLECRKIFPEWKKKPLQPDFFSVYAYQYTGYEEEGVLFGRKSIDPDYMKNQIAIMKEAMEEADFHTREFNISEWNFTISNRNVINDSCEQGAYVLKNCIDMCGEVDFMAYWHALDSYSDYYDANTPLNGDSGIISRDGFRKPSFYAFTFVKKLQPCVLYKDSHSIITTNNRDRYVIACHNYKRLSGRYATTDEDQITVDEISNYIEDEKPLKLKFILDNVRDGDYLIKIHYVNKEHGSVQDIWKRLGYRKNLAKDEKIYLRESAIPTMEITNVHIDNHTLELESVLLEQEIRLIEIKYCYSF